MVKVLSMEVWIPRIIDFWRHSHITVIRRSLELVHRWMIKRGEHQNNMEMILKLREYIHLCKATLSRPQLALLQDHDRTDFFYQSVWDTSSPCLLTIDRECLNLLIQITVASISDMLRHQSDSKNLSLASQLDVALQQSMMTFQDTLSSTRSILDFIFSICGSNDQVMVSLQIDILSIYLYLEQQNDNAASSSSPLSSSPALSRTLAPLLSRINPHTIFIYFLERTGMDYELVVDLLMSDETDMLLFLTRYLKYVERHTQEFVQAVDQVLGDADDDSEDEDEENSGIHSVMGLLYQVSAVLQSDIFPYNASVLARRISSVLERLKQAIVE
ncbi:hypothetical protein BCR42DRAFT_195733 [Absidia repens]|uniref:Protein Lines N-terminal domain-containing protein n=1 Tax=Absidia repens TaxID=90262 RepID=A0A1X2ISW5_9FUNG|nr:hypothetical protein BCR42DRAFT_195733 [Absidia repens]